MLQQIESVLSQCDRVLHQDPGLALQYAEEAYALSAGLGRDDLPLLIKVTLRYSYCLVAFGRLEESLSFLLKTLTQTEVENQRSLQENLLQEIALTYYSMGDYPEAAEYWADCLNEQQFSAMARLNAHIGFGMIYFAYGQTGLALTQQLRSVALLSPQMSDEIHARAWINLASAYFQLDLWHESQHALVVAYPFSQRSLKEFVGEIHLYMAQIALETGNLEAARKKLARAKASCKEWRWGETLQYLLEGRISLESQQFAAAITAFLHAAENAEEVGMARQIMQAYHGLSMAYQRAGEKEKSEAAYGHYLQASVRLDDPVQEGHLQKINNLLSAQTDMQEMLHCA